MLRKQELPCNLLKKFKTIQIFYKNSIGGKHLFWGKIKKNHAGMHLKSTWSFYVGEYFFTFNSNENSWICELLMSKFSTFENIYFLLLRKNFAKFSILLIYCHAEFLLCFHFSTAANVLTIKKQKIVIIFGRCAY